MWQLGGQGYVTSDPGEAEMRIKHSVCLNYVNLQCKFNAFSAEHAELAYKWGFSVLGGKRSALKESVS